MPGAAILRVSAHGTTVVYASHVALDPHPMAEVARIPKGDVLVVRTDHGHADGPVPKRAEALAQVVEVARRTLSSGRIPVFLVALMGQSQEVVRALVDAGVPVLVHRAVAAVNREYRVLGYEPGLVRQFRGVPPEDHALVLPETLRFGSVVTQLDKAHLVWLSGQSIKPALQERMRVDESIALTGHLDPDGIMSLIEKTGVTSVVTVGQGADEVAMLVRRSGVEASALQAEVQLQMF